MNVKSLLYTGVLIPVIFWAGIFLAGFIDGGYDHVTMTVSGPGALGQPAQPFMSAMCLLCAVLSLFFIAGMFRALRALQASVRPVFTILAFTITIAWAGAFPMGHPLHAATGFVLPGVNVGMLLAFILWRGRPKLSVARWASLLCFGVMSMIFLRFVPSLQNHYRGLIQRTAHAGWSLWFGVLSWQLQKHVI
ncbi:MAG TPA: DUF998 domain-containing protein [Chitinophaga sp.]